jgi:hypothetical protein
MRALRAPVGPWAQTGCMWTGSRAQAAADSRPSIHLQDREQVELVHRRLNAAYDLQVRHGQSPDDRTGGQLDALTWLLGRWGEWGAQTPSPVTVGGPPEPTPDLVRAYEELVNAQDILNRRDAAFVRGEQPTIDEQMTRYVIGVVDSLAWALGLVEAEFEFI